MVSILIRQEILLQNTIKEPKDLVFNNLQHLLPPNGIQSNYVVKYENGELPVVY
jgi:hypothetical protein